MRQNESKLCLQWNIVNTINRITLFICAVFSIQLLIVVSRNSIMNLNVDESSTVFSLQDSIVEYIFVFFLVGYLCSCIRKWHIRCIYITQLNLKKIEKKDSFDKVCFSIGIIMFCGQFFVVGVNDISKWFTLQIGLIIWPLFLGGIAFVIRYLYLEYDVLHVKGETLIRNDKEYIPQLLKNIQDKELEKYIAHELYTYALRAKFYKKGYYVCSIVTLVAPAIVVVINSLAMDELTQQIGVALFSAMATIASGLLGIVKFKESWVRYRYNCEGLKHEISRYVNGIDEYNCRTLEEKNKTLFAKVNQMMINETNDWKGLRSEAK